ncbi:MAG: hypothetical protein OXI16_00260 [Chloroflexota bacterium]|nr:hypothetical protein [Chloroflexota bacterium]
MAIDLFRVQAAALVKHGRIRHVRIGSRRQHKGGITILGQLSVWR